MSLSLSLRKLARAVGAAAGLGRWGAAVAGVVLICFILEVLARVKDRLHARGSNGARPDGAEP